MKATERIVWIEVTAKGAAQEVRALLTDQDLNVVAEGRATLSSAADEAGTARVEQALLSVLDGHIERGAGMLAGADVRAVRRFLARRLPKLSAYLHYRTIDVRTIRELVRRWYPAVYASRPTSASLEGAIEELLHYRAHAFITPEPLEPSTQARED